MTGWAMDDKFYIPKSLDAPNLFLFIEADTFVVAMAVFVFAAMVSIYIAMPAAWFIANYFARKKSSGVRSRYLHIMYWYTPSQLWLGKLHPSCQREYYGR